MGRHGKNLTKSIPLAKPMPDLGKFAYDWEKQLIADGERRNLFNTGFEQGIYTALATAYRVLIFHYHELGNLQYRLPTFEDYFNDFFLSIDQPDQEQLFAEWYYEKTTGFEFKRKADETMANKEAKIKIGEYVDRYISDAGKTRAEVAAAINRGPKVLNALRAGNVSKKVIDAIMDYLGIEFTPGEMVVFKEAYGIGNNDTARFEDMEAKLLEREQLREEVKLETADIPEDVQRVLEEQLPETLAVMKQTAIPVPDELPEAIEAVVAHEELPFTEEAPMYAEPKIEAPAPSIVDLMQIQLDEMHEKMLGMANEIADLLRRAEELNAHKDELGKAAMAFEANINIIKGCKL